MTTPFCTYRRNSAILEAYKAVTPAVLVTPERLTRKGKLPCTMILHDIPPLRKLTHPHARGPARHQGYLSCPKKSVPVSVGAPTGTVAKTPNAANVEGFRHEHRSATGAVSIVLTTAI